MPTKVRSKSPPVSGGAADHSDGAAIDLLKRIKAATDPAEIERLSDQLERVIFHKQLKNA